MAKDKTRSNSFIIYHQLKAITTFLKDYQNNDQEITPMMFKIIQKTISTSKELWSGRVLELLPDVEKGMNKHELLLISEIYFHTYESSLTEEERHILLKGLDVLTKIKQIIK